MAGIDDPGTRPLAFEYTDAAREDLADVAHFLDSPSQRAAEFTFDLFEAINHLRRWPYTGHRREDLTKHDVCFWPFAAYYIVVHVEPNLLTVIAVLHHRQNIARLLRKRLAPKRRG